MYTKACRLTTRTQEIKDLRMMFEDLIEECERAIAKGTGNGAKELAQRTCGAIAGFVPQYKVGLLKYRQRSIDGPSYSEEEAFEDLKTLVHKMKAYQEDQRIKLSIAELGAANRGTSVSISNSGNNTAMSTSNATVTMSDAVRALNESGIPREDLAEIKAALADLDASDKGDPTDILDKASKLLDLAKNAAGTARAVAPYVAWVLASLGM